MNFIRSRPPATAAAATEAAAATATAAGATSVQATAAAALTAVAVIAGASVAGCANGSGAPAHRDQLDVGGGTAGPVGWAGTSAGDFETDGRGLSRYPSDPVDPGALSEPAGHEIVERELYVMGTVLHARVEAAGRDAAREALEAAVAEIGRADRLLSTWDGGSSLGAVNSAAVGAAVAVPRALLVALLEAASWADRTGRAFDPTIGALIDVWGLRGVGREPGAADLEGALSRTGASTFTVDRSEGTVTRNVSGAWIDSGAFGKGLALRWAADTLRARGVARARLNLGGQVVVLSGRGAGAAWEVPVSHPVRRGEAVALLRLSGESVATSGNSERGVQVDGMRLGHLLDPRTGRPVRSWGSVTVVSADPVEADVLSTALYVMGPDAGLEWAAALGDVGVLYIVGTDRVRFLHNEAMRRWLGEPAAAARAATPVQSKRRER